MQHQKQPSVYSMITSRNTNKLPSIKSAKTIWDALFYKKGSKADGHGWLQSHMIYRKGILDTVSWIVTKIYTLKTWEGIKGYQGRQDQINQMKHDFPGTVDGINKFIDLIANGKVFTKEDLYRDKNKFISNSRLHRISNDRIVTAGKGFKALCFDHVQGKITLDLSEKELLSAFEVMLLPYYFPDNQKQKNRIKFFVHLCKILLENNTERKKWPSMDQIEQLLTIEQSKLEGDVLVYSTHIIQNKL